MNEQKTRTDVILAWMKNNRLISMFIVLGVVIIAIGTFTDSLTKIGDFLGLSRDGTDVRLVDVTFC